MGRGAHVRWLSPLSTLIVLVAVFSSGCSDDGSPAPEANEIEAQTASNWVEAAIETEEFRSACAETVGCEESRYPQVSARENLWRAVVTREASGELRIGEIEAIEVPEGDGVPIGPFAGPYALVGLDDSGTVVDGQPIRFPEKMRVESVDGQVPLQWIELSDREVNTVAYLRASSSIVKLAIQDRAGEVVATSDLPFDAASLDSRIVGSGLLATPALAARRPFQGLPPYCSHVLVLDGEQDRHLAAGVTFEETVTLARPGPYQLAATQAALARLTPMLCQSIGRIAYGYVPDNTMTQGAVNSVGAGDLMLINLGAQFDEATLEEKLSRRLFLQRTITHEAGHNAETLLTVEGSDPQAYSGAWGFPPRTMANKTIDRVRLEMGLGEEWVRLHESFVGQEWAADYPSGDEETEARSSWAGRQITDAGFMSQYGSKNWWDDIAEFVSHTYLSEPVTAAYREHGVSEDLREDVGCQQMQAYGEKNLPARFTAVYTKLHFIQDLGLVEPEDVRYCMGESLDLPIDGEGFHVWQETMKLRSFENRVSAGIGTTKVGTRIYQMEAYGEANFADKAYPAKFYMRLDLGRSNDDIDRVPWPRGVYQLGLTGNNNLELRLDGAKAGNFDAMDGFVLVAEASNDRIAGSIVLQRVFRLDAPLPVPEKYDPPLIVRFMIEN